MIDDSTPIGTQRLATNWSRLRMFGYAFNLHSGIEDLRGEEALRGFLPRDENGEDLCRQRALSSWYRDADEERIFEESRS